MKAAVSPRSLSGTVSAPPSKSIAHRALICAALAQGESHIYPVDHSKDMDATIGALRAMGANIIRKGKHVTVHGIEKSREKALIDCIESGSTVRFMIPVAAALGIECCFSGSGRLPERPLTPFYEMFPCKGVSLDSDKLPMNISGTLSSGEFTLRGDISSQFITGLLFALPLLDGDSTIRLTTKLESAPYIDLTLDVLKSFVIEVEVLSDGYAISGGQQYRAQDYTVEGDYSNGAFWLTCAALGNDVKVSALSTASLQGDRKILSALEQLGAQFTEKDGVYHSISPVCRPAVIDGTDIPDIIPILCVAACAANGTTVITGTRRLKIKESDRAAAMVDCLTRLGAEIREEQDRLVICGGKPLHGASVSGYNDHRIVMSMAIASCLTDGDVTIDGIEAVKKSYPGFFDDFTSLGGAVHVL